MARVTSQVHHQFNSHVTPDRRSLLANLMIELPSSSSNVADRGILTI